MRQLNSTRIQKQETIQSARRQPAHIQPRLDMLAVNLAVLVLPVRQPIIVLHLRSLSADLDHIIQIGSLHREAGLLLLPID